MTSLTESEMKSTPRRPFKTSVIRTARSSTRLQQNPLITLSPRKMGQMTQPKLVLELDLVRVKSPNFSTIDCLFAQKSARLFSVLWRSQYVCTSPTRVLSIFLTSFLSQDMIYLKYRSPMPFKINFSVCLRRNMAWWSIIGLLSHVRVPILFHARSRKR